LKRFGIGLPRAQYHARAATAGFSETCRRGEK
jgi:hypothetical protein